MTAGPDYETRINDAIKRAKNLDKEAETAKEPGKNPTTGVYRLVEEIQKT